ncbi:MAG: tetratricopeptide repeat protein [Gaiellales bacterium]
MRSNPVPPEGDDDPLDAALGELVNLADFEQRFAMLDARLESDAQAKRSEDDDPFSDIARALREQRAQLDADADADHDEPSNATMDADQLELALNSNDDDDDDDDDDSYEDSEDDPFAVEIEGRCQDALDAIELGDLKTAREMAMNAVRLDDEHPFPMFVLGLIAEQEGDLDTARDMAELSLRTAGTNPDAIALRAHIHVCQHELAEADGLLRFGIAHNPDEAMLHEGLARVSLARGSHDEALLSATTALRIEPGNPGAMSVRTAALEASGDRGALLAALRQGVQLHPEDPYAMVELASVEMENGNLERARILLMRAQRLAPKDPEISDVRRLIEHVHERPLLRPVPGLLRWMRDFPGGLAGFIIGFLVAALPLHAVATTSSAYRIPAYALLFAWGATALYAWIAPAVLTVRLNQRAARGGATRLGEELRDPLSAPPSIARLADVTSMLVAANDRRGAVELLALAARRSEAYGHRPLAPGADVSAEIAAPLNVLAGRLRGPRARVRAAMMMIPGLSRVLVAASITLALAAPALDQTTSLQLFGWYAIAVICMAASWVLVTAERTAERDVDDAFTAIHLTAANARGQQRS